MRRRIQDDLWIVLISITLACVLFLPQIRTDIKEREAVQAAEKERIATPSCATVRNDSDEGFGCEEAVLDGMSAEEAEYYTTPPYPNEPWEEEKIEGAIFAKAHRIADAVCTFYCIDSCGKKPSDPTYGITASGKPAIPYHTVAVDPSVIPLGASVAVDYGDGVLHYYFAEDTGGAIKGKHIDVYLENCTDCYDMGVKNVAVWWWFE